MGKTEFRRTLVDSFYGNAEESKLLIFQLDLLKNHLDKGNYFFDRNLKYWILSFEQSSS